MTTCEAWSVVVVPFPFVDLMQAKRRPAVVMSARDFNDATGNSVLAMVTRGVSTRWPTDLPISDLGAAGLKVASVIRCRLFTLDNRLVLRQIGTLARRDREAAKRQLRAVLDL